MPETDWAQRGASDTTYRYPHSKIGCLSACDHC